VAEGNERGQASAEYVGLVGLVAVALAGGLAVRPRVFDGPPARVDRVICTAIGGHGCRRPEMRVAAARTETASEAGRSPLVLAVSSGTGRRGEDADGDGLSDAREAALAVDPRRSDSDGDGRSDRRELERGGNPLVARPREAWVGEHVSGRPAPDPRRAAPADVARFFAAASPPETARLTTRYPEIVGSLDGAPPALRYRANRLLVRRAAPRLRAELRGLRPRSCRRPEPGTDASSTLTDVTCRLAELQTARRRRILRGRLRNLPAWAAPDRQLLVFDPRGDGRGAEVVGDLDRAPNVAVAVPGMGSRLDHLDSFRSRAVRLRGAVRHETGADVAVVAWIDYDAPDTLAGAALAGPARRGAPHLARLAEGIRVRRDGHLTVIGHSYGSVVTGTALARRGLEADDAVLTGSPGTGDGRRQVSELGGRAHVWAAESPLDLVPYAPVHGRDPASPRFGARRFDASGQERTLDHVRWNHLGYDRPGSRSLANVARIVGGRGDLVTAPRADWRDGLETGGRRRSHR